MHIGESTTTVEVESASPQVNTTTAPCPQVIDQERVVDLPLNGRNAASLITLVAGVVDATNEGNGVNQGNGKTFPAVQVSSTNGTLPNQSNYLLDGGNNVDEMTNVNGPFPFPDALQEFSVQTSNYNAEYGQSAGAVVNIVTNSGTSKFHGTAFEFLRNGYFNAQPLLRHRQPITSTAISSAAPSAAPSSSRISPRASARSSSSAISTLRSTRTPTPPPPPSPPSLKKASPASPTPTSATSAPPATPTTSATPPPSASPIHSPTSPTR